MKVVWLAIHFPLVPKSGGDVACARMLESLAATGCDVHAVHIHHARRNEAEIEAFRNRFRLAGVHFVTTARESLVEAWLLRLFLVVLLPFLPVSYSRLMWPNVRRRYRTVLASIARAAPQAPVVVCEGLQPCALLRAEGLDAGIKYVYRAHNVERDVWRSSARLRGPLVRAFMVYQAWRVESLEKWVLRRFSQIHAISREDQAALQSLCAEPSKVHFTPVAMEGSIVRAELQAARRSARAGEPLRGLQLLFLGKLDWPPNRDGLAWFLDKVWNELLEARPDARLTIVGPGEARLKERYGRLQRLRFTGYASDAELRQIFLSRDLLVVPIFSGSGVRVKVLEAALHGLPSIGTDLGMKGSFLEPELEFIRVDGAPTNWIDRLAHVHEDDCEALGRRAFEKIQGTFSRASVNQAAAEALKSLARPGT